MLTLMLFTTLRNHIDTSKGVAKPRRHGQICLINCMSGIVLDHE